MPSHNSEVEGLLAVALLCDSKILLKRRSEDEQPYPGQWSLPTTKVRGKLFCDLATAARFAAALVPEELRSSAVPAFLAVGRRSRQNTVVKIQVVVYHVKDSGAAGFRLGEMRFIPLPIVFGDTAVVDSVLSVFGAEFRIRGTASEISPYYLEVPPELAHLSRDALQSVGAEELWRIAYPNYRLYLDGLAGGTGWITKQVILTGRISWLCWRYMPLGGRILDYGGGEGTLRYARSRRKYSVVIHDPVVRSACLDVESTPGKFEGAICSLVLPWISDIDLVFREIASSMRPGSMTLVSIPNPVTFRTGYWSAISFGEFTVNRPAPEPGSLTMIGHTVGPLKAYPRSLAEITHAMTNARFAIVEIDDRPATPEETTRMREAGHPFPNQYCKLAPFVILVARLDSEYLPRTLGN